VSSVVAQNTATSTSAVEAAAATALTLSPTSHVKGKAFDRIAIIFLENTDKKDALDDREYSLIYMLGCTLSEIV
jgi:acid phosphatase